MRRITSLDENEKRSLGGERFRSLGVNDLRGEQVDRIAGGVRRRKSLVDDDKVSGGG